MLGHGKLYRCITVTARDYHTKRKTIKEFLTET